MFFKRLFGKKSSSSSLPEASSKKPIRMGPLYFIKGEDVIFDLNGLDFTFQWIPIP